MADFYHTIANVTNGDYRERGSKFLATAIPCSSEEELKSFIDTELAYKFFDPDCDCGTGNESIYTLLSFITTVKGKKYPIYINNMRGEMESAQAAIINILNKKALNNTFIGNKRLQFLKEN